MKIEINIDVEAIVREEIRTYVRENITINNVAGASTTVVTEQTAEADEGVVVTLKSAVPSIEKTNTQLGYALKTEWEYAPKIGRRRNKTEIALHEKELELGRTLTPEEKGKIDANVELADESEAKAKADTKNQARINKIAAEATDAAAKELAEEATQETPEVVTEPSEGVAENNPSALFAEPADDGIVDTVMPGEAKETIPPTEDLKLSSLFS